MALGEFASRVRVSSLTSRERTEARGHSLARSDIERGAGEVAGNKQSWSANIMAENTGIARATASTPRTKASASNAKRFGRDDGLLITCSAIPQKRQSSPDAAARCKPALTLKSAAN
jgi:hypothetical protein